MATRSSLDDELLRKMNGLVDELNSGREDSSRSIDPYKWVMDHTKPSATLLTVQRWARNRVSNCSRPQPGVVANRHEDFVRYFDRIKAACADEPMGVIRDVMGNKGASDRDRMAAAKLVSEAVWPERHGPHATRLQVEVSAEPSGESSASDESQEVWDEMTEDESTELDTLLAERDARQSAVDAFVKTIRGRVAAKSSGY